jgi:phosphate transport system substrate-binding protein
MNRRHACVLLAGAALGAACRPGPQAARQALLVSAAFAMLPLATALAEAFLREPDGLPVLVERGGSLPSYIAASRGAIDVAAMTRALSDTEDDAGAHQHLIARDHLGIVVHPSLPVPDLALAQLRAVLSGTIDNWRMLGGPDLPLTVHAHARSAAARQSAEQLILDGGDFTVNAREHASDAALMAAVAADPGAIACCDGHTRISAGTGQVATLSLDGVRATPATVLSRRYPCTHSFYLLLHGEPGGARAAFLRFARSAAGQAIVEAHGLVPVC